MGISKRELKVLGPVIKSGLEAYKTKAPLPLFRKGIIGLRYEFLRRASSRIYICNLKQFESNICTSEEVEEDF
jgi:hypothetical protein